MPFLAHPLALLGLFTLAGLTAVYLLRNRFQPRWVSSLMLWRRVCQVRRGGPFLQRFKAPWLFLLELLILALLTLAAAHPQWIRAQSRKGLTLVLDDSASMTARGRDGRTPRERALAALGREIRNGRFRRIRLFLAGPEPSLVGSPDPAALAAALRDWAPGATADTLDRTLALAAGTAPPGEAFLVLTDHRPAHPDQLTAARWLAFGEPLPNRAFVHAVRAPDPAGAEWISVEAAAYGSAPGPIRITVRGERMAGTVHDVSSAGDQPRRLRIPLPADAGAVMLALEADALDVDNTLTLLPKTNRMVRSEIRIASAQARRLLERAVQASGRALPAGDEPDLLWTDGTGEPAGSRAWIVEWRMPEKASILPGPFLVQRLHPLMEGLSLDGVAWGAAPLELPGVPLVMANGTTLVALEEKPGRPPRLRFQLVSRLSTLQAAPAWPAWIANILDWRAAALPGFREPNAVVLQPVHAALPAGRTSVALQGPEPVTLRAGRGGPLTWYPERSGIYGFRGDDGTAHTVSVNWMAAAESDLRACTTGAWGRWPGPAESQAPVSLAWVAGLAGLALLALHHLALANREERA